MSQSISQFFAALGAPLSNVRWSWGAIRPTDGAVFLRVWADEAKKIDGFWYTQLSFHQYFRMRGDTPGYSERLQHIEKIRIGAPAYLVLCRAVDPNVDPRVIEHFDDRDIFVGGELREIDGDSWIQRASRQPAAAQRLPKG